MFYFLDEPVEPFVKTANGGLSTGSIIAIVLAAVVVLAVAIGLVLVTKKRK